MRYVRSWPEEVPQGRAYVTDGVERLVMTKYDYTVLGDVGDDVLLIEWDLAVGQEELQRFAARAASQPDRPLAAPYRLYPRSPRGRHDGSLNPTRPPEWTAWRYTGPANISPWEPVEPGTETAPLVSFGFIYLPQALIQRYLAERQPDWRFSDVSFCGWHHRRVRPDIDLDWRARPVHLHYPIPDLP